MQFSFSHHRLKINILWLPEQAHRFTGYLISDPGVQGTMFDPSEFNHLFIIKSTFFIGMIHGTSAIQHEIYLKIKIPYL